LPNNGSWWVSVTAFSKILKIVVVLSAVLAGAMAALNAS